MGEAKEIYDAVFDPDTAVPVREALVVRPGDHLIVRIEGVLTHDHAAAIKERVLERLPLLSDVTVICADGLAVFRHEVDRG